MDFFDMQIKLAVYTPSIPKSCIFCLTGVRMDLHIFWEDLAFTARKTTNTRPSDYHLLSDQPIQVWRGGHMIRFDAPLVVQCQISEQKPKR